MTIIEKALAAITTTDESDDAPHGGFEAIASAPTLDRDGDVFATSEWKTPLPEHITIDIDHEMTVAGTIGSAVPFIADDGTLRIRAAFSSIPRAQEVRTLMQEGHIRTVSVACMADRELKKAGEPHRELLNVAVVGIPSNREALVTSVKSGARNSKADAEHIQAIHDHAVALGAEPVDSGSGASDGANKSVRVAVAEVVAHERVAVFVGKSLQGSVEDLRARINTALSQVYADLDNGYPWLRATFLNDDGSGGTIVYDLDCSDNGDVQLARDFTDDGATITLSDEFAQVQIVQSVQIAGPVVNTTIDPDQDGDDDTAEVPEALAAFRSAAADALAEFDRRLAETKTTSTEDGAGTPDDDADAEDAAESDAEDAPDAEQAAGAAEAADSAADEAAEPTREANEKAVQQLLDALTI